MYLHEYVHLIVMYVFACPLNTPHKVFHRVQDLCVCVWEVIPMYRVIFYVSYGLQANKQLFSSGGSGDGGRDIVCLLTGRK
jgi:hypothetical protein